MRMANITGSAELLDYARSVRVQIARKFETSDVASDGRLAQAARLYANTYRGDFPYMVEMSQAVARYGQLTPGQAKGVLNCLAAERRQVAPVATVTAPRQTSGLNLKMVADGRYRVNLQDASSISVRILTGVWSDEPTSRQIAVLAHGADGWQALGKIFENGEYTLWRKSADQAPRVREALTTLANADDRLVYGLAYALVGQQCSFCGLNLDTDESITAGYGPTCAEHRGLPWGDKAEVPASVMAARAAAAAMVGQAPVTIPAAKPVEKTDTCRSLTQSRAEGRARSYEELFGDD